MIGYVFVGGTAVVTGAGSGIGAALARGLAARGSHLVLVDRAEDRLSMIADPVRREHRALRVETVVADLSEHDGTVALGARLATDHPETTLLVNNAGVALAGTFEQLSLAEFEWLTEVNFRAVVSLTHGLLPVLLSHPGSHLVNVSSVFGLLAPPTQTAYAASKFAVRGFTEALRAELAERVGVTCVHPGGINTRIAVDARVGSGADADAINAGRASIARLLRIPPERAAEAILNGVQRRRPRVLIGATARLPDLLVRALPGSYGRVLNLLGSRALRSILPDQTAGRGLSSRP